MQNTYEVERLLPDRFEKVYESGDFSATYLLPAPIGWRLNIYDSDGKLQARPVVEVTRVRIDISPYHGTKDLHPYDATVVPYHNGKAQDMSSIHMDGAISVTAVFNRLGFIPALFNN